MLFYFRHGNDELSEYEYEHDHRLRTVEGSQVRDVAQRAVEIYGFPHVIYCSPLLRAVQTAKFFRDQISTRQRRRVKVVVDDRLSRFFNRREQLAPSLHPATARRSIPVLETWEQFQARVINHYQETRRELKRGRCIWCVTHALAIKEICTLTNVQAPEIIGFMDCLQISRRSRNYFSVQQLFTDGSIMPIDIDRKENKINERARTVQKTKKTKTAKKTKKKEKKKSRRTKKKGRKIISLK